MMMMMRIWIAGLVLLLAALPALAQQRALADQFGRTVTVSADGKSYAVSSPDGFSATVQPVLAGDDVSALRTINGMAPASFVVPTPKLTVITRTQFLARFTPAELTAISAAARTNDAINVWLITAQAHDVIDLLDPLTKQGLDALVSAGILTAAREAAILTP